MPSLRTSLPLAVLLAAPLVACASPPSASPRITGASQRSAVQVGDGPGPSPAGTPRPVTALDPGLVVAFEQARAAAALDDEVLVINSGYRTPERQRELLDEEVAERGSLEEASRWVFTPERSMHVQGLAIDVGDGPAADWLEANGATWGLCRTLGWEWWHFEWRARWEEARTCPAPAEDPAGAPTR